MGDSLRSVATQNGPGCKYLKVRLDRQASVACLQEGACDTDGTRALFSQASNWCSSLSTAERTYLRCSGRAFFVILEGENGIDDGGVYRDCFEAWSRELTTAFFQHGKYHSSLLTVFMPTLNQRENSGEDREAWMVAPTKLNAVIKRQLRFLGNLMGICIREGDKLPLCLSRASWKRLVGEDLNLDDLQLEDLSTASLVRMLLNVEALHSQETFEEHFGHMTFVFQNSAGEEVPLTRNGGKLPLTYANAEQFGQAILRMRCNEVAEQVRCIRAGIDDIVPLGALSLWTWQDLKLAIAGSSDVDIELLKKNTHYTGYSESSEPVRFMWKALESFRQEDRRCFIRFCWGRSVLPQEGEASWGDGFKVHSATHLRPDSLPRAHTCFFQIDLPQYPSQKVCTEKILYAVRNCVSVSGEDG